MTPEEVARRVLCSVGTAPEASVLRGASDDDLARLRAVHGPAIPDELEAWLRLGNGVLTGQGGFYGVGADAPWLDVLAVGADHPGWVDRGWVPVAGDGCGNHYVVDLGDAHLPSGAVFLVDCCADPDELAYVVASGVLRFLWAILESEERPSGWLWGPEHLAAHDPAVLDVRPSDLLLWNAG